MPGMPSSDADLWPDSWSQEVQPRSVLSLAGIALFLVAAPIAIAVYLFAADNKAQAGYATAFAAICALILWIGYESRFRRRRAGADPITTVRLDNGSGALKIPYSLGIHVGVTLLMAAFAVLFSAATVHTIAVNPPGERAGAYLWAALAALFASFPLLLLRRKYALGYLLVSPEGIHHRGWTFQSYLPWQGIKMIHPLQTDGPDILITATDDTPWEPKQITRLWRADKPAAIPSDDGHSLKPAIHIPGKYLAADPALVLAILVFYGKSSQARYELATETALHRAQSAHFGS